MIIQYEHHGKIVSVKKKLKGRHKNSCLCYAPCAKFDPMEGDNGCLIASEVYANCVKFNIVTPVWECPEFEQA